MFDCVVYFDLIDRRENKIHRISCKQYEAHLERRRLGILTTTTRWDGPFPTRPADRRGTDRCLKKSRVLRAVNRVQIQWMVFGCL